MLDSLFGDIRDEPMSQVEERTTILGYAGLLPFFALLFIVWMHPALVLGSLYFKSLTWGLQYGAIILSFMGGIHWGIALVHENEGREITPILERFSGSVIPALIGWIALIPDYLIGNLHAPAVMRIGLMLIAFIWLLAADNASVRHGHLPDWYGRLRQKITFFLAMCLLLIMVRLVQIMMM